MDEKKNSPWGKISASLFGGAPSPRSFPEEVDLDRAQAKAALDTHETKNKLQKIYAAGLFILVFLFLLFISTIVLFLGFKAWGFELSDTVMVALLTSTTISIVALVRIVTKYLFPA